MNSLKTATDLLGQLEVCSQLSAEDWAEVLRLKVLTRSCVHVKAFPSALKVQTLEKATKDRESQTRKQLGEKGLLEKVGEKKK